MRNVLRQLGVVLAVLVAAGTPVGAQQAEDDYRALSSEADEGATVPILVTGWHAVTGDESEAGAASGGLLAVTGDAFVKSVAESGQVSEVRRFEHLPVIAMTVDGAALSAAKDRNADVLIWKDLPVETFLADSGPMVGADRAHSNGYTGKGTFVAIVDTGVDIAHPFIAGRPILEACFADRCPNGRRRMVGPGAARPVHSHGTHVAGIALGRGEKMSGVAPEAGLIAINVFERNGGARNSNLLGALDWLIGVARTGRIAIASVNMSLGGRPHSAKPCRSRIWEMAARLLARRNVALVAASGNERKSRGIAHPACVRGIVSVGAIDKAGRVARFSNSAPILDLLAPGVAILSSVPRSGSRRAPFKEYPGTSMAAPHVAGAFAVLRQAAPQKSLKSLYRALVGSGPGIRDRRNGIVKPGIEVTRALAKIGVGRSAPDGGGGRPPEGSSDPPAPPKKDSPKEDGGWRVIGD